MNIMKIKYLTILLLIFTVLSCEPKEKNSGGQDKNAENIETNEVYFNDDEQQKIEDIGKVLQVWTRAKSYPFRDASIPIIIYGNGRFLAAGDRHDIKLAYSDDGDTWYEVQSDVIKKEIKEIECMAFGNGRFVAVGNNGGILAYSDDGITWVIATTCEEVGGISYGNGRFAAVASNSSIAYYSDDGKTWIKTWIDVEGEGLDVFFNYKRFSCNCITYGNGMFLVGAGDKIVYSNDCETWKLVPGNIFEDLYVDIITYGNGRFVAVGKHIPFQDGRLSTVFFSDNGIDWAELSDKPIMPVFNILYANGIFISGSNSASITYSIDGKTWYPLTDHDRDLLSYGEGFAEYNRNHIRIEALQGDDWSVHSDIGSIAYGKGRFVIGSGNGAYSKIVWCDMPEILNDTH